MNSTNKTSHHLDLDFFLVAATVAVAAAPAAAVAAAANAGPARHGAQKASFFSFFCVNFSTVIIYYLQFVFFKNLV